MRHYILSILFFFLFVAVSNAQANTADMGLSQTVSAGPYFQNNEVTFTLVITNNGPTTATNVALTNTLPANVTFVRVSPGSGSSGTRTITHLIPNLANGSSVTITIVGKITGSPGSTFTNIAAVSAIEPDPNPANNSSTLSQTISAVPPAAADLAVSQSLTGTPETGENITLTVVARNNGPVDASGVSVTDILPANLTFVSASATTGSYNVNNGVYSIGNLAVNASATLTIIATINTSGSFVNTATVAGSPVDPDNTNNTNSLTTCVLPDAPARLEINGSAATTQVCIGKTVELKVPVVTGATEYVFNLPTGFTTVQHPNKGTIIQVTPGGTSGPALLIVQAVNACGASLALQVNLEVSAAPPAPVAITGNAAPCSGSEQTYSVAPVAGATTYTWTLPSTNPADGWAFVSGETTTNVTVRVGTTAGTISVKTGNTCENGGTQTLAVAPTLTPVAPVSITDSSSACNGLRYVVNPVANAAQYTWTVPEGWTIEAGQGTRRITVKAPDTKARGQVTVMAENGECKSAVVSYAADAARGDGLLDFPNAFSPNGDNQNDRYTIGNLQKYPDNDILIINRWGNQVYKKVNYQNDWDAKGLGDGTYFYVVRVKACNDEQKIYRGYITIAR